MYTDVNWTTAVSAVQTKFNSINGGNSISFDSDMGEVIDELMLQLPIEDPSKQITWQAPVEVMDCGNALAVGINEINNITDISVYPNPTTNQTTVKFNLEETADVSVKIYNILGIVLATPVNSLRTNSGAAQITFDASNLAAGAYNVLISTENGASFAQRVVVQ